MNYNYTLSFNETDVASANITPYNYVLCNNETIRLTARGGQPASYFDLMRDIDSYARNNNKDVFGFIYKPLGSNPRLFLTNKCDYLFIKNTGSYSVLVDAHVYDNATDTSDVAEDYLNLGLTDSHDYFNALVSDDAFTYYNEPYNADLRTEDVCLYDLNMTGNSSLIATNNLRFYNHFLMLDNDNEENYKLELTLGSNYSYVYNNAYDTGYSGGYGTGYNNGYQNGFNDGHATNETIETAQAFDYIGGAFGAVASILEIEVLPHISLGLCFSIPLVLVLIMTIFKLVRK